MIIQRNEKLNSYIAYKKGHVALNTENLHELINRYEANIDTIYGMKHDELFKWRAMKVWHDEWFKPEESFASFADRFNAARKEFSLFIDNSRMHPSNGVIKLWEKEPETVERLFCDVLFADTDGDVSLAQDKMEEFLGEYEKLRQKYYPGNWSYKQDRHSASVFLAMNDPSFHYVYKSSEALIMAKYTDFGFRIGTGMNFSLANYYRLCDEIVAALKEHETLLEKHFNYLKPETHFIDESLHLLAFDLMYCCDTYKYYKGLTSPATGKTIKKKTTNTPTPEEQARQEEERLARIEAIEQEIADLEHKAEGYDDISLIGVQVTTQAYGTGVVISQEFNKIKVQFASVEKSFVLDKKYSNRPVFEDDEAIVSVFSEYGQIQDQIKKLRLELRELQR